MRAILVALALVCCLFIAHGSAAPPVQCGSVLGPGGTYKLTADLTCVTDGVTLTDGAILNLNGYTLFGGSFGVRLIGHGTIVRNGTVTGGGEGIVLKGSVHTVRNVHVSNSGGGILDGSHNSQILENTLAGMVVPIVMNEPIAISGTHGMGATISGNDIVCNNAGGGCIHVFGPMARVENNTISCSARACAGSGILVADFLSDAAVANVIARNEISGFNVGIKVQSIDNLIERNDVRFNTVGLVDQNGNCSLNTWRNNVFFAANPACID